MKKKIVKFLVSTAGRGIRIALGLILIALGFFMSPAINWPLVIIGIIPLSAGLFDFCLFAPLLGYSLSAEKTRMQVNQP